MDSLSDNILPNGTIIKYQDDIYEIGGHKTGENSKLYYLVTSSIWGGTLGEIEDSSNLLLWNGKERIHRAEFRADLKET